MNRTHTFTDTLALEMMNSDLSVIEVEADNVEVTVTYEITAAALLSRQVERLAIGLLEAHLSHDTIFTSTNIEGLELIVRAGTEITGFIPDAQWARWQIDIAEHLSGTPPDDRPTCTKREVSS